MSRALSERISVVTDEVDLDIRIASSIIREWGLCRADVRSIDTARVPWLNADALAGLRTLSATIAIGALSPGLFKGELSGESFERECRDTLPATLRLAESIGVERVIVFGGGRAERMEDVVSVLREARDAASRRGIELLVENSSQCRVADSDDLLHIAHAVGIRVVWDPANAIAGGSPGLLTGSQALADHAACVHVRDWHPQDGWRRLGEGVIPWATVIDILESTGFRGSYVVESHLPDDPGASGWNVERLAAILSERT